MVQISITQALAELKLLRKRIDSELDDAKYIVLVTKNRPVDAEKFSRSAQSSFQSYRDLLDRYNRMKAAIVTSNATAKVTIAGREYSVAEAVERKRSIHTERRCLCEMQSQWTDVKDEEETHNKVQQERLDKLVLQELGKDSKTSVDVVNTLTEAFWRTNKAHILDPLGLEAKISSYKKDVEDFETNVDWVLSESNGRTLIEV